MKDKTFSSQINVNWIC